MEASKIIVNVENLNKNYGKQRVLKDVSFKIYNKEIVGLIGPNGAGKSTLMKCLSSLVSFSSGNVTICGYDIVRNRENALSVQSSLIEHPGMFPEMTGMENLYFFAKLRNISKENLDYFKEYTGLGKDLEKKTSNYSLGMKQRLGLAIALLAKPKFLILDEPMNGLDPDGVMQLRFNLIKLIEENDMCILISSHQLGEIDKIATRLICINHGELITQKNNWMNKMKYLIQTNQPDNLVAMINETDYADVIENKSHILEIELNHQSGLQDLVVQAQKKNIKILDIQKKKIDIEDVYKDTFGEKS